ncbi:glutathione S-transferase C-terminal domain-containing protein [Aquamicrobium terrae]|uniref:glutathione S-transferase C-terminal domain-containing protein n=1 Tax=Aquamicrobium terrae TaxID=1324945 RepID=UPI0033931CFC
MIEDQLTEADIRLFTTLIRFDGVYVGHFNTNLRRIADHLAVDFEHIRTPLLSKP